MGEKSNTFMVCIFQIKWKRYRNKEKSPVKSKDFSFHIKKGLAPEIKDQEGCFKSLLSVGIYKRIFYVLQIDIGKCSPCSYIPKNVKSFLNWYIIRDFKGLKPFFSMINICRSIIIIIIIIIIKGIIIQLTFQYHDSLTNIDVNVKCIFPS